MRLAGETRHPTDPYEPDDVEVPPEFVGLPSWLEILYTGSPVGHLLNNRVQVTSKVSIYQTLDRLPFRHTDIFHLPTDPYILWKVHHVNLTSQGGVTTVVTVDTGALPARGLGQFLNNGARTGSQGLAMLITALDERIARRRIATQLKANLDRGQLVLDETRAVRHFESRPERDHLEPQLTSSLQNLSSDQEDSVKNALDCYLAALNEEYRVSPVGYIILSAALDALCPGTRNRFNLHDLRAELASLQISYSEVDLREIISIRGDITHKGLRAHEKLAQSWPKLEDLVRQTLRRKLGINSNWPTRVAESAGEPYETHNFKDIYDGSTSNSPKSELQSLLNEYAIRDGSHFEGS